MLLNYNISQCIVHIGSSHIAKILVVEHWFHHVQPHDQPWGQNLSITFQVKGQGQRAHKLEALSYRLMIVGSSVLDVHLHNQPC